MEYTLFFIIAAPLFMAGATYLQVRAMSTPEKMMRPIAGGLSSEKQQIVLDHKEWLTSKNLHYITSFQFGSTQVAAFQQTATSRFFCFYFGPSFSYDIMSIFDDTNGLTTASNTGIGMFPFEPGTYKQGFPQLGPDLLWQRHMEAEAHLINKFGFRWQPLTKTFEQMTLDAIRRQMLHVRSIPLYPFRAIYWFTVKRKQMANRTIQQQYP
jgi:hypothetical protein